MSKKISYIPEDLKAKFPDIVKKAIEDGLRCEPADRNRAEKAFRELYTDINLNATVPIVWVNSPIVGALAAPISSTLIDVFHSLGYKETSTELLEVLEDVTRNFSETVIKDFITSKNDTRISREAEGEIVSTIVRTVLENVKSQLPAGKSNKNKNDIKKNLTNGFKSAKKSVIWWHTWRGGQFWINWPAFVETCLMLGIDQSENPKVWRYIKAEGEICRSAGYYWPNKNFIMVCERPHGIKKDDQGRLHSETGPAIDYGDTFKLYFWHGVSVPKNWIMNKSSINPQDVLLTSNIEQRRAGCEILGWNKILEQLNAVCINKHPDPMVGELLEVTLPDAGEERFLKVLCGTNREFALPVPKEVNTALEAQAWTWGLNTKDFIVPEVRT